MGSAASRTAESLERATTEDVANYLTGMGDPCAVYSQRIRESKIPGYVFCAASKADLDMVFDELNIKSNIHRLLLHTELARFIKQGKEASPSSAADIELHESRVSESTKLALECCICLETMDHPCSLICGHSACRSHLQQWFETKNSCPSCNTSIPASNLRDLHLNIALNDMINKFFPGLQEERRMAHSRNAEKDSSSVGLLASAPDQSAPPPSAAPPSAPPSAPPAPSDLERGGGMGGFYRGAPPDNVNKGVSGLGSDRDPTSAAASEKEKDFFLRPPEKSGGKFKYVLYPTYCCGSNPHTSRMYCLACKNSDCTLINFRSFGKNENDWPPAVCGHCAQPCSICGSAWSPPTIAAGGSRATTDYTRLDNASLLGSDKLASRDINREKAEKLMVFSHLAYSVILIVLGGLALGMGLGPYASIYMPSDTFKQYSVTFYADSFSYGAISPVSSSLSPAIANGGKLSYAACVEGGTQQGAAYWACNALDFCTVCQAKGRVVFASLMVSAAALAVSFVFVLLHRCEKIATRTMIWCFLVACAIAFALGIVVSCEIVKCINAFIDNVSSTSSSAKNNSGTSFLGMDLTADPSSTPGPVFGVGISLATIAGWFGIIVLIEHFGENSPTPTPATPARLHNRPSL